MSLVILRTTSIIILSFPYFPPLHAARFFLLLQQFLNRFITNHMTPSPEGLGLFCTQRENRPTTACLDFWIGPPSPHQITVSEQRRSASLKETLTAPRVLPLLKMAYRVPPKLVSRRPALVPSDPVSFPCDPPRRALLCASVLCSGHCRLRQ